MKEPAEKLFIGVKEAAEMLNVSMPTMYRLASEKDFPAMRAGSKFLINKEKLYEWARKKCGMEPSKEVENGDLEENEVEELKSILAQQMKMLHEDACRERQSGNEAPSLKAVEIASVLARQAEAYRGLCLLQGLPEERLENYIPRSLLEEPSSEEMAE